jgi:hypothetical protein
MSKIYNIAFRMGVSLNILLFTMLNVISFKLAENDYIRRRMEWEKSEIKFSGGGPSLGGWGLPFDWNAKYFVIEGAGAILNIIIMAACGFAFGFLFKFVWKKFTAKRLR